MKTQFFFSKNFSKSFFGVLALFVVLCTGCPPNGGDPEPQARRPPGINSQGQVTQDVIWEDIEADPSKADYEIGTCIVIEDNIVARVAPGVVIKFTGGCIDVKGALIAKGTEEKPIIFDKAAGAPEKWGGIIFHSNNPLNELEYCTVANGGNPRFGSEICGAVTLIGNLGGTYAAQAKITHTIITNSKTNGLCIDKSATCTFALNALTNNELSPARIAPTHLGILDAASNYANNTLGYVAVKGETAFGSIAEINQNIVVTRLLVPYQITEGHITIDAGSLTISEATELRFAPNTRLVVKQNSIGGLFAQGTAARPVVFRGVVTGQGRWDGIHIAGLGTANYLRYCTIDGGGQNQMGLQNFGKANIVVGNVLGGIPSKIEIRGCTIKNSAGYGVCLAGDTQTNTSGGVTNNDLEDLGVNTFTNNQLGNIRR